VCQNFREGKGNRLDSGVGAVTGQGLGAGPQQTGAVAGRRSDAAGSDTEVSDAEVSAMSHVREVHRTSNPGAER